MTTCLAILTSHSLNNAAAIIAFIAIIKSFLGHYLGAQKCFNGLVERLPCKKVQTIDVRKLNRGTAIFMLVTTWLVATLNPGVLDIIESLGGPVIAILLFLMPMYAISKVPACVNTQVKSAMYLS